MAQPIAQPTPAWPSLREARELVTRRLSSALAKRRLVEGLDAKRIKWRHGHIENSSGVSIETALDGFWRSASINWDESWAARKVEAPPVAARGGVAPGGIVWASPPTRPTQPSSQLGNNFAVYDIRLAREDVELLLREYGEPDSPAELRMKPMDWLAQAYKLHPRKKGEQHTDWAGRLSVLMRDAPVTECWQRDALNRRLYDLEKNERERIARERAARERTARGRRRD